MWSAPKSEVCGKCAHGPLATADLALLVIVGVRGMFGAADVLRARAVMSSLRHTFSQKLVI